MAEVDVETPIVKKQRVKKNKDVAPATEPKKMSKRRMEEELSAPNTAPEATKTKKVRTEEVALPPPAKELKKKKRRAPEALDAPAATPEQSGGTGAKATAPAGAEGGKEEGASPDTSAKKPRTQQAEDAANPGEEKQGKKRRRRGKKVGEVEGLTAEEQERRQRQRELRALALQMRGEGKAYKKPLQKKAKVESATQHGGLYSASQLQGAAQQADEEGSRPAHSVQVIVVPIFWNRKPDEKAQVIRAAEAAVKVLKAAGLTTGMDTTNAMSPGQKFAYWEGQGVMVRIECGPRDTLRRECVLAVSKKAGEVAERQTLPVGPKLVKSVGAALGVDVTLPALSKPTGSGSTAKDVAGEVVGVKRVAASGDDLRGDFGDLTVEAEEGSKKKRKK